MKREVILAIVIGFGLGLVITLGIWVANKSLKNLPQTAQPTPESTLTPNASPTTTQSPTGTLSLSISAPEDESLASTNKTTLSGKTAAGAAVTVTYEGGQTILTADATSGEFTFEAPLIAGYNVITVTALDATGQSATQTLTVTYTTAKI